MVARNPLYYDPTGKVHTPVPIGDTLLPALISVSARTQNQIQNLDDGLYVGSTLSNPIVYVNSTGTDATTSGSMTAPYKTLDYALAQVIASNVNGMFTGQAIIALQAGQAFTVSTDVPLYDGSLLLTFYGDANYGNWNSAPVGTGALPAMMSDLNRPTVTFVSSVVNSQSHMSGFNLNGGTLQFSGITILLPAAPAAPSIALYSIYTDVVRSPAYSKRSQFILEGCLVNMTDITAFWGLVGIHARSSALTFVQYGSAFLVQGVQISASIVPPPAAATLLARQYFIKFYPDFAGNNQQTGVLQGNTTNSTTASGLMTLLWADTESLVVATGKTNQGTFPIAFDVNFGLRNYIFGLDNDQSNRPLNIVSSRLF